MWKREREWKGKGREKNQENSRWKMREKKVMKLASRGKRLGAFCIDAAVPVITTIMYIAASIAMIPQRSHA